AEKRGELFRAVREALVADLEEPLAGARRAHRLDVAAPRPRAAARVGDLRELLATLGLDPEARLRAVREPRVVGAVLPGAQPAAFEEGADDIAPVPHRVHR